MIVSNALGNISPIILSLLTIVFLMLFELGNEKIRHSLRPLIIVLIATFLIVALFNILEIYLRLG